MQPHPNVHNNWKDKIKSEAIPAISDGEAGKEILGSFGFTGLFRAEHKNSNKYLVGLHLWTLLSLPLETKASNVQHL